MKKTEREKKLKERFISMRKYEEDAYGTGIVYIAGVDEVGRGPLAGPVVAAAVVLPRDFDVIGIDDSKKLSSKKREEFYEIITNKALAYGIGMIENGMIDEINILNATKLAMIEAVNNAGIMLKERTKGTGVELLLVDAVKLEIDIPAKSIIKGDSSSISIASASIVAKVVRDRIMIDYNDIYPGYAFDSNKGYGTKAHYEGIRQAGTCPIHRSTYLKNFSLNA